MATYPVFAQQLFTVSAEDIELYSGTVGAFLNGSAIQTAATIPATILPLTTPTTGTLTGTPTVDTGAVSTYQTRGVAATPAIVTWKASHTYAGIPTSVQVRIPAVQLLTFTGAPTIFYPIGVTNVLPVGIRPGISAVNFVADMLNNSAKVVGRVVVGLGGELSLQITAGTAVTGTFGLAQDIVVDFIIVAV